MTPCPKPPPRPPAARKRIPRNVRPRTRRPLGTVRREAKAAGDLTPEQCRECGTVCQQPKRVGDRCRPCYAREYARLHRGVEYPSQRKPCNQCGSARSAYNKTGLCYPCRKAADKAVAESPRRVCRRCKRDLPARQFSRHQRGIRRYCKRCMTAQQNQRAGRFGYRQRRRMAIIGGDLDEFQWAEILRFYSFTCAYCDAPWQQQDHVRPLARGGTHTASNVVPACAACNYAKGTSMKWKPRRPHPFMAAWAAEEVR